ncbi:uncharacterized protein LOC144443127 [Glandiceps talaboti]
MDGQLSPAPLVPQSPNDVGQDITRRSSTSSPQPALSPVRAGEAISKENGQDESNKNQPANSNICRTVILNGVPIAALVIDNQERLCLAQISNTLLKQYSYNEIHNRRVALGVTCVQCTPVQLEILRRAGAMPISSRRCGMITKREAERLCKSFLGDTAPPKLPENFAFDIKHECAWGCRGSFIPSRYNSSRAKCIKCAFCNMYFSPNKFIFHSHRTPSGTYKHPDAANFNSWRRHIKLAADDGPVDLMYAWEDVKAMFNGGSRKRIMSSVSHHHHHHHDRSNQSSSSSSAPSLSSFAFGMTNPPPEKRSRLDFDQPALHTNMTRPFGYPLMPMPSKTYAMQGESMLQKKTENMPTSPPYPGLDLVAKKHLSPTSAKRGFSDILWGNKELYSSWGKAFGMGLNHTYYPQPASNGNILFKGQPFPQTNLATERGKMSSPTKLTSPLGHDHDTGRRDSDKFSPWDCEIRKKYAAEEKLEECTYPKTHFQQETHNYVSAFKPVTRDRNVYSTKQSIQPTDLSLRSSNDKVKDPHTNPSETPHQYSDKPAMTGVLSEIDASDEEDEEESDINITDDEQVNYYVSTATPLLSDNNAQKKAEDREDDDETQGEREVPIEVNSNEALKSVKSSTESLSPCADYEASKLPSTEVINAPGDEQVARLLACQVTSPVSKSPPSVLTVSRSPTSIPAVSRSPTSLMTVSSKYSGQQSESTVIKNHGSIAPVTSPTSSDLLIMAPKTITDETNTCETSVEKLATLSCHRFREKPNVGDMAKDELEKALLQEMYMRKRMEQECQLMKDTFQNQVKRELAFREEMSHQLQIVRDTLCHELDAERKARLAIQQKLKTDDGIGSQQRRPQPIVDQQGGEMDRSFSSYWRLAMLGPTCLPAHAQQWRAMMPLVMNGETTTNETGSELNLAPSATAMASRLSSRSLEIYGNSRRASAF